MAEFSHVHRTINGVAEVDVVGDGFFSSRTTVTMTGVHQFIIVAGIVEHPEETIPVGTSKQDDMVLIHLANCLHTTLIKGLQQGVERILISEVMGDRFIHQLVAQNRRFLTVTTGYLAPDVTE